MHFVVIFFSTSNPALNLQLERAFQKQQETEMAARLAEKERLERERLEARKRKEVQRITDVCYINYYNFFINRVCLILTKQFLYSPVRII